MHDGTFIKLQTKYYTDPKMIAAGPLGCELYNRACCFAQDTLSDGVIWRDQLPCFAIGFDDPESVVKRLLVPHVSDGKSLWNEIDGGWVITAYLNHNRSCQEVETLRDKRKRAGKAGAEKRWQNAKDSAVAIDGTCQHLSNPVSVSVSVSGSSAIETDSQEGSKELLTGEDRADIKAGAANDGSEPENNDGLYTPDDPLYQFDPRYDARVDLDYWQKTIGKIQPAQLILASNTLTRLHNFCRRSKREIRALIKFVGTDKDAKRFWGKPGSSPLGWLRSTDGGDPTWIKIRAAWLAAGGSLPMAKVSKIGPAPAIDYACGCRRGWIENDKQETQPCPKCDFGKWLLAGGRL